MATSFNQANRLPDDVDYAFSHRPPPPIPPPPIPSHDDFHNSLDLARQEQSPSPRKATFSRVNRSASQSASAPRGDSTSTQTQGRSASLSRSRGNSFSFLRRSPSNKAPPSEAPPPPVPALPPAALKSTSLGTSPEPVPPAEGEGKMLRKASAKWGRKTSTSEEQAGSQPRQTNTTLSLSPLPAGIASFDDSRPDSVAIFEHSYKTSNSPPQRDLLPRPAANFSRPQAMAPVSASNNSSSSPGYAVRSGGPSSSPPYNPGTSTGSGEYVVDPYEDRTQSITNRGRFSYASSHVNAVNSPRRVRRRKDPTPFNVLVMGAKNSGKTSFVNFLRHSLSLKSHTSSPDELPEGQAAGGKASFTSHYLETEMEGERVGLTLWDSAGLEKNVVDLQLREMAAFVESKFEDTFVEEQKVMRSPGVKDTHIHCVLLVLDPVNLDSTIAKSSAFKKSGSHAGSLDDDLDLQVMRALWGKTTVIPVISKADTLTVAHMTYLKRAVWESLKTAKLDPLEALELEEDAGSDAGSDEQADGGEEEELPAPKPRPSHKRLSSVHSVQNQSEDDTPYLPMSILSPDIYDLPPFAPKNRGAKVGRRFPWGFADPHNPDHCDFGRLRDSVFLEWRSELRELSRSKWYENWRTSRLKNLPGTRQRVRGGVTPVASVPREGRIGNQAAVATSVPRSVCALTNGSASMASIGGANTARREVSGIPANDVSASRQ